MSGSWQSPQLALLPLVNVGAGRVCSATLHYWWWYLVVDDGQSGYCLAQGFQSATGWEEVLLWLWQQTHNPQTGFAHSPPRTNLVIFIWVLFEAVKLHSFGCLSEHMWQDSF